MKSLVNTNIPIR